MPPLQDDREEFQLQTEDILRERFKFKNFSTGIKKYIYSHELDQDILNLKSTRRDKIYFVASQQVQYYLFAFIPITSDFTYCTYWKHEILLKYLACLSKFMMI